MNQHRAATADTSVPPPPAGAIDDLVQRDVNCPMCGYNLRGLIEPRCPECGFTFLWVELLDPARWIHPYVFEHHPQRNLWSFFKTLIGGLRPGRFWDSLMPSQPSNPARLRLYLAIVVVLSFAGVLGALVASTWEYHSRMTRGRTATLFTWGLAFQRSWEGSGPTSLAVLAMILPAWALLTYWTMMIFGTSMHIAKVNPSHVFRCIVYCLDVCVWCGLVVALVAMLHVWDVKVGWLLMWAAWATSMSVLLFAYRMCQAYRLYMRFRHAIATVVATQIIVGLVMINAILFWLVSR